MISKFKHIKNVGRFRDFSCSGDQALRKTTLFFGENGRGKSTISAILRSLTTGEPRYIHERQTLGADLVPSVEILLPGGMSRFDGTAWTSAHANIEIFDQHFVAENIHVGESVETNNRRGLAAVILGQKGAEISKRIREHDQLARDSATAVRNAEDAMASHIPSVRGARVMELSAFLTLPFNEDIDGLISAKKSELEASRRAVSLGLQQDILPLPIPGLPSDFAGVLSQTLENVSADAEAKVRKHLEAPHVRDAKDWLSDGVEYLSGPTCPVCGRSTEGMDIISAYKAYFSEEYETLRKKVHAVEGGINDMLGVGHEKAYTEAVSSNVTSLAFWVELIPSLSLPDVPNYESIEEERSALFSKAIMLAFKKDDSLLESVSAESLDPLVEKLKVASKTIVAYNEAVALVNTKIAALKSATESAKLADVEAQLSRLNMTKVRHSSEFAVLLSLRDSSKVQREHSVAERQKAQVELSVYSESVVGPCEERINEILSDFGAGFRIRGVSTSFPSGTAASTYGIEVNGEVVEATKSRGSTPTFHTMLSGGDKSALALAFFFAAIDHDADKSNKIIFLDDPFNSQDEHRRNQTAKLIQKYASECTQILVSSHNPDFLRLVWNDSEPAEIKCLKLRRDGIDDTVIEEWDIERSTKHPFLRLHDELNQYLLGTAAFSPSDIIQKLRPLLEDYIRFRFPNVFPRKQWIGDMIRYFGEQGLLHPMASQLATLSDINDYTSPTHHSSLPINETELRGYVQKTLNIVGQT